MLSKSKNIFSDKNLSVLPSQFCEALKNALETFWEQDVKVTLLAINDYRDIRSEKLIKNTDFFSSQIKIENHKPIIIRLSKEFTKGILISSLGSKEKPFKFNEITPLEIKILNGFSKFFYKKLKNVLRPVQEVKLSEKSEKNINILFLISTKNSPCSKLMISIPQDRLNLIPLKKTKVFNEEEFLTSNTLVRLKAGSSKITFDELQNLAPEDIILLEESEPSKMTLISGNIETKFNIKVNPSLILNINDNEEFDNETENIKTNNEVIMEKNLWDDIQIEINAEFEKVKMTIGELKQITQGQIIDLGSVFDNEISLFVEDRKVAKGDLIIINDRYAVRLNEILSTQDENPAIKTQTQQKAVPKPQTEKKVEPISKPVSKAQVVSDDEEFDYSDFEK